MKKFKEYLELINESSNWKQKLEEAIENIFKGRRIPDIHIEDQYIWIDYDLADDEMNSGWLWDMIYYDDIKKAFNKYSNLENYKAVEIKSYNGQRDKEGSEEKTFVIKLENLKQIMEILENK